jgi:hypothetical protein
MAVMTCLTAVLTLKVVVPANTGFANRKWLEMLIEAKAESAAKLRLIQDGPGYCTGVTLFEPGFH